MNNDWLSKIEKIREEILNLDASSVRLGFEGRMGEIMFLYSYDQMKGTQESREHIQQLIDEEIDIYNAGYGYYGSFWSGLSSLGWTINYLYNRGYLEDDYGFSEYSDSILEGALLQIGQLNDFLNGSLGMLYYLMNIPDQQKAREYAGIALDKLIELSIENPDGSFKWMQDKSRPVYNISLSHGSSSIVCVLCKIYSLGVEQEKCKHMIEGAVKYILAQKLPADGRFISFFPNLALESETELMNSRIAWCYGDLGIALMLRNAAETLGRKDWGEEAHSILLQSSKRRDLKENTIIDACFCHGAAGATYIFAKAGKIYGDKEFKEAAEYWADITLNLANFEDGPAGYKFYDGIHSDFLPGYGILEGIAGVGLGLMGCVSDIDFDWDACLLIS